MTLEQKINDEIKRAMLAREKVRLESLRAVKAAILLEKTSGQAHELTDADITRLMQKLVKQRRESAEIYSAQNRPELAENELAEAACIEEFLPRQLSADELEKALGEIISETGASSPADMGRVMGVATKRLAGRADGKTVSETVKRLLSETAAK